LGKWEVFIECPYKPVGKRWRIAEPFVPRHEEVKVFSMIIEAKTAEEAEKRLVERTVECPFPIKGKFHHFTVKTENVKAVRPWPPSPPSEEERKTKLKEKLPPTVREAPTQLLTAKRFPDNTVAISIRKGTEQLNILYARPEVETFDKLMKTAKAAGQDTLENAILAYMLATTGGTATMATGFLTASGFKTDRTSVGEAISRMVADGTLYKYRREIQFVRKPLPPFGAGVRRWTSEILGEPVYGMSEATRTRILERLKIEPYLAWWTTEMLKPPPPTLPAIKKPVEYEWIKTVKAIPKLRAEEDFKYYGPYKPDETAKLPIALAYFLTRQGYAEWLNPEKETVKRAEEIFKFMSIEKLRRQATLTEF
jgi:hypothetical protein